MKALLLLPDPWLLQTNTKIGPTEHVQLNPFFIACMHGHQDIVELFLRRYLLCRLSQDWCAHAEIRYRKKSENKMRRMINANAFATPVLIAAMNSHHGVLRTLLKYGGDPNQPGASGELPLFALIRGCGVRSLPNRTFATPTAVGATGTEIPPTVARERRRLNNTAMLRQLLSCGADAKARTATGESAIELATRCGCGEDVLSLLRKHGAS